MIRIRSIAASKTFFIYPGSKTTSCGKMSFICQKRKRYLKNLTLEFDSEYGRIMSNQTEEIIFHILDCLPDKNHQTHRLLFCSLLKISQDRPKESVRSILAKFESIQKSKHEGNFMFKKIY